MYKDKPISSLDQIDVINTVRNNPRWIYLLLLIIAILSGALIAVLVAVPDYIQIIQQQLKSQSNNNNNINTNTDSTSYTTEDDIRTMLLLAQRVSELESALSAAGLPPLPATVLDEQILAAALDLDSNTVIDTDNNNNNAAGVDQQSAAIPAPAAAAPESASVSAPIQTGNKKSKSRLRKKFTTSAPVPIITSANIMSDSEANKLINNNPNTESKCKLMKSHYGVVPFVSFGRLPMDLQSVWNTVKCDKVFKRTD